MKRTSTLLRTICWMVAICMLCSTTIPVSAIVVSPDFAPIIDTENDEIIIGSQQFSVQNGVLKKIDPDEMQPYAEAYTPGDIDIQDVLGSSSGWIDADRKQLIGQAALNTSIAILSSVPKIGTVVSTVGAVIDTLEPYYSFISSIDYSKSFTVETSYSYRHFTHRILVYTHGYQWKEVGTSISRFYYRHAYARAYDKTTGDYKTAAYDFTHSNGCSPTKRCKAPNYMKYDILAQRGREAYASNLVYRETYND